MVLFCGDTRLLLLGWSEMKRRLQIFSFTRRGKPYVFAACAYAFMGPERGAGRRTRAVMTLQVGVLSARVMIPKGITEIGSYLY